MGRFVEQLCGKWINKSPTLKKLEKRWHSKASRRNWKKHGENFLRRVTKGWSD